MQVEYQSINDRDGIKLLFPLKSIDKYSNERKHAYIEYEK